MDPLAKRRWPMFVLAAGGLAAAFAFRNVAPAERVIQLRMAHPESVQRIELTWIDGDGDAVGSSRWSFDHGAPRQLTTRLRARDGSYRAQLIIERHGAPSSTSERRVTFSSDAETILPLQ